jgi:chaperonin GroES
MNVVPLRDLVLVTKDEVANRSAGGIYVPDIVDEKTLTGVVKAVGPGKVNDAGVLVPVAVKVGDRVAFSKSTVMEVKVSGQSFCLLQEASLLCVVSE